MGSKNSWENEDPMEIVRDHKSKEIIYPMAIKSVSETLQIVDRVMRFSQPHGNEELDESSMTVTEKLQDIQITKRRQQEITYYFYKEALSLCKID